MLRIFAAALVVMGVASLTAYFGFSGSFGFTNATELRSPTETSSALPDPVANVIEPTEVLTPSQIASARSWSPPQYENQSTALGWSPTAFQVPASLRRRVDFWKSIYTQFSTDEGVLHDPVTLNVYDSVRFRPYRPGESLTAMARERSRLIDSRRALIAERLLVLQERLDTLRAGALTTPLAAPNDLQSDPSIFAAISAKSNLQGEEAKLWSIFENDPDPKKFARAASRIRFQLGQRDKIRVGIYNSGRYLSRMEALFRAEGLPIQLTRLPFVESSFNTQARSKVGASGIWQFMRRTAKPYLKISSKIDERNDPLIATRAAARMMKSNYQMLGSWPLAVTAWNHGPTGVRTIVQKLQTEDLGVIVSTYSSRTFGFASQNFYACFLAILEIEADAPRYFSKPLWDQEIPATPVATSSKNKS